MPKYVVRYGSMRHLGVFSCRARDRYARGQQVITRTGRGQESGEVLCEATEHVLTQMGQDPRTGQILRLESHDDSVELRRLQGQQEDEFKVCKERIAELGLDMQLIKVERLYGGERVIVYYLSEERVDFRELVKVLARDLQTRIEMRQIGVRDEAKLLADYGDCGKPVCCNTHLSEMPPVSMKMAKLQKATLDPTKISGRCGRLKCCLRYEYDTYQELQRELPRVGYEVLTRDGKAHILSQEILTGELLVETEDSRRVVIQASDVLSVVGKSSRGKKGPQKKPERGKEAAPSEQPSSSHADKGPDADKGGAKPKSRRRRDRPKRAKKGDAPEATGNEKPPESESSSKESGPAEDRPPRPPREADPGPPTDNEG